MNPSSIKKKLRPQLMVNEKIQMPLREYINEKKKKKEKTRTVTRSFTCSVSVCPYMETCIFVLYV